jgi:FKBP-type peptidyl-prolyl cis-trans isomerase
MRTLIFAALGWASIAASAPAQQAGQAQPPAPQELKTTRQKGSYGIGVSFGNNLRRAGFDLDLAVLMRGLSDALAGAKLALTPQEIQESLVALQQESTTKAVEKNKAEGTAFHAKNKQEKGIVTLPSGLQYKVVKSGVGKVSPKATDTVSTHYKGTLLNGTVFDDSYARGQPETFPVGQVIKGWTEALQLMKVGDKWQLFIPGNLGYGENGNPQAGIGPNSTLLFDIELMAIEPVKP